MIEPNEQPIFEAVKLWRNTPVYNRGRSVEEDVQSVLEGNHMYREEIMAIAEALAKRDAMVKRTRSNFQARVQQWMLACFGHEISQDLMERSYRFFEEATELVQATGMTREDAYKLVDYVFDRPIGEPGQEVGGVMITLAALCSTVNVNMESASELEYDRVWTKVDLIREKQKSKPKHSPLPQ